jgi:hypothetical protein
MEVGKRAGPCCKRRMTGPKRKEGREEDHNMTGGV